MPPRPRILVIDDDPIARDLAATALRGQGYEVFGAARFAQGIEEARARRPHLVISDVVLPDGSGIEFARTLRREVADSEMPIIILMSAFSKTRLEDQRRMKEEASATAFLTKPLSIPALVDLVGQRLPRPAPGSAETPPSAAQAPQPAPPAPQPTPSAPQPVSTAAEAPPTRATRTAPAIRTAPATPKAPGTAPTLLAALASAWRKGWTGTLTLSRSQAQKEIVLERGQVVWATTTLMDERFGRVVMRLGFLSRDQYESSLREAVQTRRRLGEVLVARGHLAASQRDDALVQQMEDVVLGALAWPEGTYRLLAKTGKPATDDRVVTSPVPQLVLRAFLEVISSDRLDARLAALGGNQVVRRAEVPPPMIAQLAPTPEERRFLDSLTAPAPVDALLARHPRGPETGGAYLGALLALGVVGPAAASADQREADVLAAPGAAGAGAGVAPRPAAQHAAAEAAATRLLQGEAAFEEGRLAIERNDLGRAADAMARAIALCPEEGEFRAWGAWVRALAARQAFDATLEAVAQEMETAAGLSPSSDGVYELIEQVITLRMLSRDASTTAP